MKKKLLIATLLILTLLIITGSIFIIKKENDTKKDLSESVAEESRIEEERWNNKTKELEESGQLKKYQEVTLKDLGVLTNDYGKEFIENVKKDYYLTPEDKKEIKGWKTYKNTKYGYELKYPTNVVIRELGLGGFPAKKDTPDIFLDRNDKKDYEYWSIILIIPPLSPHEQELPLEDLVKKVSTSTFTKVTINGREALYTYGRGYSFDSGYSTSMENEDMFFFKKDKQLYIFSIHHKKDRPEHIAHIADLVLSSFTIY